MGLRTCRPTSGAPAPARSPNRSGSRTCCRARRRRSPEANASGPRSRGPSSPTRSCCCSIEPLTALDHATASHIIDDLRAWNTAHAIPILYVTHAHREAFALGERLVFLDAGKIVATGTPHELLDSPASEPLARFAGFENLFSGVIVERRPDAGTMQCRLIGPDDRVAPRLKRRSHTATSGGQCASRSAPATSCSPSRSRGASARGTSCAAS